MWFLRLFLSFCLLFLCSHSHAAIRLGVETRQRARSINNIDHNDITPDRDRYIGHRTRFYMEGDLPENVTLALKVQSRGVWGRPANAPTTLLGSSITFTNQTPDIENIFVAFNDMGGLPATLTVGRQPLRIGQGFVVDDNGLGLNAVRFQVRFPFRTDLDSFYIKTIESAGVATSVSDQDGWGTVAGWEFRPLHRFSAYYIAAFDKTGATDIAQNFIGGRVAGRFKKYGLDYRLEFIRGGGREKNKNTGATILPYRSNSIVAGVTAFATVKRFGDISFTLEHARGGGGNLDHHGFSSPFARRFDGIEREGYGEYFAASLFDAFEALPAGHSGIRTTKTEVSISPLKEGTLTVDYINFNSASVAGAGAAIKSLGFEFDASLAYQYSPAAKMKIGWAYFKPRNAFVNKNASRMAFWEVEARF